MKNVEAIVNYLALQDPEGLQTLRNRFPQAGKTLTPGKMLGTITHAQRDLLLALSDKTLACAHADLEKLITNLGKKIAIVQLFGLGSSVLSSASSAGLIAILLGGSASAAIYMALITFTSSLCVIISQYLEKSKGGAQSLNKTQETLAQLQKNLIAAEGDYKLTLALNQDEKLEGLVRRLIEIAGELRHILVFYPIK